VILWIRIPGSSGIRITVAAATQGLTASELTEKIEAPDPDMSFFDVYFLDEPDYFLFPGSALAWTGRLWTGRACTGCGLSTYPDTIKRQVGEKVRSSYAAMTGLAQVIFPRVY